MKIEPWIIDVSAAGLLSIGLNMLAAILFAFTGHGWTHTAKPHNPPKPALEPVSTPTQHAAQFAVETLQASSQERVEFDVILEHYKRWCSLHNLERLSNPEITAELCRLLKEQGFTGMDIDGVPYIIGIMVKPPLQLIEAT